jgi:hypothetical protein
VFGPSRFSPFFVEHEGLSMSHLWVKSADGAEWAVSPLIGNAYALSGAGLASLQDHGQDGSAFSTLLIRGDSGPQEQWFLLARKQASVHVNGWPLVLGVRLLCDRDEINVRAGGPVAPFHYFFSTEALARVEAYPGGDVTVRCPRCKQPLEQDQMAVRCPNGRCGAWHHQEAALPCWTYCSTCALCDQPTQLDLGFCWTPEKL